MAKQHYYPSRSAFKRPINFTLTPTSNGLRSGSARYFAHIVHNGQIGEKEAIRAIADESFPRIPEITIKSLIGRVCEYIADQLAQGNRISIGDINVGLSISGSFDSANAEFDPEKHRLNVVISPRKSLKSTTDALKPMNITRLNFNPIS